MVREISSIADIALPIEERWTVRRCRYAPEAGGAGRICIATGIHGDEMMGQLIVYGVAQRILGEPGHLHGVVDLYPMLNPLGLDVGQRMTPLMNMLDMNRAFPGAKDGTALEGMCHAIYTDMLGADLVLDIHSGTMAKSELYEVRLYGRESARLLEEARALHPELIWILPERRAYDATLTGALCAAGTPALVLEVDEHRRRPKETAARIVDNIFCKMTEMGLWTGACAPLPHSGMQPCPCIRTPESVCRVTCECPGVYVPEDMIGAQVAAGDRLGVVIDALSGEPRETVLAPRGGLVFSQRSYSPVYPGTLIARIFAETPAPDAPGPREEEDA